MLSRLTRLLLDQNQLTALPKELGALTALQELHVHDNQLVSIPAEIAQLPLLQQLAVDSKLRANCGALLGSMRPGVIRVRADEAAGGQPSEDPEDVSEATARRRALLAQRRSEAEAGAAAEAARAAATGPAAGDDELLAFIEGHGRRPAGVKKKGKGKRHK